MGRLRPSGVLERFLCEPRGRPHRGSTRERCVARRRAVERTRDHGKRGSERVSFVSPARLTASAAAVEALIAHAVAGRGLIQGFDNWFEPHFGSGVLVPLLRDWWPEFEGPNLYFTSRFMPTTLRAFVDLVRAERHAVEDEKRPYPAGLLGE